MMRWRQRAVEGLLALGIAGAAIALTGPDLAQARSGYTVYPATSWKGFHLRGANGYLVAVAIGQRSVTVQAISRTSSVSYTVPARIQNSKVKAQIGRLGALSMRVVPTSPYAPTTEPQGDCRGRLAQVQDVMFKGSFRWRGERGFSRVSTHAAAGLSVRSFREVCRGESAAIGNDEAAEPFFIARARERRGFREVLAFEGAGGIGVVARKFEERKRMSIDRIVNSFMKAEDGLQDDVEENRTISPRFPFRGSAELRPGAAATERWRGNLEAEFPGQGFLRLAGREFVVSLNRGE